MKILAHVIKIPVPRDGMPIFSVISVSLSVSMNKELKSYDSVFEIYQ